MLDMEQITATNPTIVPLPAGFWSRWVIANGVGGVAGCALGSLGFILMSRVASSSKDTLTSTLTAFLLFLPWFTASIVGFTVGLAQWLALRSYLRPPTKLAGIGWVLLTAISCIVAVLVTGAIAYLLAFAILIPYSLETVTSVPYEAAASIPGLFAAIAGGATIGFGQWIVLQHYVRGAVWWIPANSAGWLIGVVAGGLLGGLSENWTLAAYSSLGYGLFVQTMVVGGIALLVIGAITGLLLIWLSRPHSAGNLALGMSCLSIVAFVVLASASFYSSNISINPSGQAKRFQMDAKVRSVAFSPDSRLVAAGDENYGVKVWRIDDGQAIFSIGGTRPGLSELEQRQSGFTIATWSPDGKYLATTASEKSFAIRVWDTSTWQAVLTSTIAADGTYTATSVPGIAWSPNSKTLAAIVSTVESCCDDNYPDQSDIQLFDMTNGKIGRDLINSVPVISLSWSPDGKRLALSTADLVGLGQDLAADKVVVWDLFSDGAESNSQETTTLMNVRDVANLPVSLRWSPDGKLIALGSYDANVGLLDVATGQQISLPTIHERTVNAVAWSPDSKLLATASGDLTAKVITVPDGRIAATFKHPRWATSVDWSPDGKLIVTGSDDGGVRLWAAPKQATP